MLQLSKNINLNRIKKTFGVLGRSPEEANKDLAKWFYPIMQIVDILELNAGICVGGMDQRKVHILAKEIFKKKKIFPRMFIHTKMVEGLSSSKMGEFSKMSKSKIDNTVFFTDSFDQISKKIDSCFF